MARVVLQCRPSSHPFSERDMPVTAPVKIGRAVAGCKPGSDNGYFNCKVLSRNHAVLWYEGGKFYLQDTASSNGTFVNNQKLPTGPAPTAAGTPGTLKGDPQTDRREVFSGDVVQFGVEVLEQAKKGAQSVTHGCIVASLKLYHPDGSEVKSPSSKFTIVQNPQADGMKREEMPYMEPPKLTIQEVYELQSVLQEAHHREHVLESKLAALNKILTAMERKDSWNATFQEDLLLSKIQYLQGQLQSYEARLSDDFRPVFTNSAEHVADEPGNENTVAAKPHVNGCPTVDPAGGDDECPNTFLNRIRDANLISDDYKISLMAEWKNMLEERARFETVAKDTLQRVLCEKLETTKTLAVTEERLFLAQNECDELSTLCQQTQKDLLQLVAKCQQQQQTLEELTRTYQESERVKLECLDNLKSEKIAMEEHLNALQRQYADMCNELKDENDRLQRKLQHWNGSDLDGAEDPRNLYCDQNGDLVNGKAVSDDDDLLPQEHGQPSSCRDEHELKSQDRPLLENIFQGKDVAQLVKQMQDLESDEDYYDDHPTTAGSTKQVSSQFSFEIPRFPNVDSRIDRPLLECQKTATISNGDHSEQKRDMTSEMEQLLEGNERLTELVTKLQADLVTEREQVRLLTCAISDNAKYSAMNLVEGVEDALESPAEEPNCRSLQSTSMVTTEKMVEILEKTIAESSQCVAIAFPPSTLRALWNDFDSCTAVAFLFLAIWLAFFAVFY